VSGSRSAVLERTPGVAEATVSLMTNTAAVRFDPA
jgi:copper chaperone CopZ